jgi:maltose-binding protein MalE
VKHSREVDEQIAESGETAEVARLIAARLVEKDEVAEVVVKMHEAVEIAPAKEKMHEAVEIAPAKEKGAVS